MRDPDDGRQTIYRSRTIDMVSNPGEAADRILPALWQPPYDVGSGRNAENFENRSEEAGEGDIHFDCISEGDNVLVVFNEVAFADSEVGYIMVNSWDPGRRRYARPAIMNNLFAGPIDEGDGHPEIVVAPRLTAGCCERIVGTWVLYLHEPNDPDVDLLQGRRFFGQVLPD